MNDIKNSKYTILYDGDCPMCRAVIDKVENSSKKSDFNTFDITKENYLPFSKDAVTKEIHVVSGDGAVYRGSDAILKIIDQYSQYNLISKIARLPLIRSILSLGYRIIAVHRHFIFGRSSRIFWLKNALILALLSSFLLSVKLWVHSRSYPLTPFIKILPAIAYPWDYAFFITLLLLLLLALVRPKPRKFLIASVVGMGILALLDQSRWQPEFYEFFFLLLIISLFSWDHKDPRSRDRTLLLCQLIIGSIYFWSGLQKVNPAFITGVFPWMLDPLIHSLPQGIQTGSIALGLLAPFAEILIGVGLLTKRFRNYAVISAVFMHLFILFSIGPLGYNWNSIVWPWNIAMSCFVMLLFWNNNSSLKEIVFNEDFLIGYIVLILFGVMPFFSFFGLWDSYLSFTLYSGNTSRAVIYIDNSFVPALPAEVEKYAVPINQNRSEINISAWSFGELNVPAYPEARIFKNIAGTLCALNTSNFGVELVIEGKPYLINGPQADRSYNCSELEGAK